MVSKKDSSEQFHVGGIGLPMIDCITTARGELNATLEELKAGYAVIAKANEKELSPGDFTSNDQFRLVHETRLYGEDHIREAIDALTKFENLIDGKWKPKEKATLDSDQDAHVKEWFGKIIVAAIDIKRAAEFVNDDSKDVWNKMRVTVPDMTIRHMGGTTYNKLHGLSAALGSRVKTHMLGALKVEKDDDHNESLVRSFLDVSRIHFEDLADIKLPSMAIGYPYQKEGDRVSLKSNNHELVPMLKDIHFKQVEAFAKNPPFDMYIVEAGDFSPKKFGSDFFAAWEKAALSSHKPIALGFPTDTGLILNEKNPESVASNRDRVYHLINASNTTFIGANEEEAVAMLCNEKLCKETSKDGLHKAEEQIVKARNEMQRLLLEKMKHSKHTSSDMEPVAFISNGVKGVYAITAHHNFLIKGAPNPDPVNNIGSGDALFSGSLSYYIDHFAHPEQPLVPPKTQFSEQDLIEMFNAGQRVASAAVGQKGAQVSPKDTLRAIHGNNVPVKGKTEEKPELPEQSLGQAGGK